VSFFRILNIFELSGKSDNTLAHPISLRTCVFVANPTHIRLGWNQQKQVNVKYVFYFDMITFFTAQYGNTLLKRREDASAASKVSTSLDQKINVQNICNGSAGEISCNKYCQQLLDAPEE
jgi:hypothetical protein